MDTILQRIHDVFRHHRTLRSLNGPLIRNAPSTDLQNIMPHRAHSCALIKLRSLQEHLRLFPSSFYTYISRNLRKLLHHLQRLILKTPYDTYPSPSAEQRYWDSAERGLRQLRQSDARFVGSERPKNTRVPEIPPLVMYYAPALLPQYRDGDEKTVKRRSRKGKPLSS